MITVKGLTQRYRDTTAVDDLSWAVRPGVVIGFLGPNGAVESTTTRLVLELESGRETTTFGGRTYAELSDPVRTVGALLDATAAHPARTARDDPRMVAAGAGLLGRRTREVLSTVGLDEVRDRRVGTCSLGTHQRLGLATALLGDSEYPILDEPAKGLAPDGVHWMRAFLRNLAAEGQVVCTSAHLLSEMSMTAAQLVVLGQDRLIAAQPVRGFVDAHTRSEVVVRSPQAAELEAQPRGCGVSARRDSAEIVVDGVDSERIGALAARGNLRVREPLRSRLPIVVAKATVVAGSCVVTSTLAVLVALGVLIIGGTTVHPASVTAAGFGAALYVTLSGLIGLALAGLARHAVTALAAMIVWPVLELTLASALDLDPLSMPFVAARELADVSTDPQWSLSLPLTSLAALLLVGTVTALSRRDT